MAVSIYQDMIFCILCFEFRHAIIFQSCSGDHWQLILLKRESVYPYTESSVAIYEVMEMSSNAHDVPGRICSSVIHKVLIVKTGVFILLFFDTDHELSSVGNEEGDTDGDKDTYSPSTSSALPGYVMGKRYLSYRQTLLNKIHLLKFHFSMNITN